MATFKKSYNPNRSSDWNYGGNKWRLSRSKIELFVECPRCFYLDNKLGTSRPRGPSFTLNIAVDALLKKEFDVHRKEKSSHPLMDEYGIDAVPFQHASMDIWRENFKGMEFKHLETGFVVSGAVDDVWQNPKGELISKTLASEDVTETVTISSSYIKEFRIAFPVLMDGDDFTI